MVLNSHRKSVIWRASQQLDDDWPCWLPRWRMAQGRVELRLIVSRASEIRAQSLRPWIAVAVADTLLPSLHFHLGHCQWLSRWRCFEQYNILCKPSASDVGLSIMSDQIHLFLVSQLRRERDPAGYWCAIYGSLRSTKVGRYPDHECIHLSIQIQSLYLESALNLPVHTVSEMFVSWSGPVVEQHPCSST